MATVIFPSPSQINDNVPQLFIKKATGIIIRNNNTSAQNLWIGIDEEAAAKIILAPGESLSLNVDRDDDVYAGLNLYFKWAEEDASNGGFVIQNLVTQEIC